MKIVVEKLTADIYGIVVDDVEFSLYRESGVFLLTSKDIQPKVIKKRAERAALLEAVGKALEIVTGA